jgi:hypothetical protein
MNADRAKKSITAMLAENMTWTAAKTGYRIQVGDAAWCPITTARTASARNPSSAAIRAFSADRIATEVYGRLGHDAEIMTCAAPSTSFREASVFELRAPIEPPRE